MKLSLPLPAKQHNPQPVACFAFIVVLAVGLSSAVPVMAAPLLPPNSFLRVPVTTVQGLIREVSEDPIVANRYARLFRMSPTMVKVTFAGLHLTRLPEERPLQIWGIGLNRPEQPLIARVRRVSQGEPIFAGSDNTPVLLVRCGNPIYLIHSAGPTVSHARVPLWQPYAANENLPLGPGETDFALPTVSPAERLVASNLLLPPVEETTGPIAFAPPTGATPAVSGEEASVGLPGSSGSHGNLFGWLAPLPILAALGSLHGGGGSHPAVAPPLLGPVPVPEGGLKSLLGAVSLLGAGFMIRRAIRPRTPPVEREDEDDLTTVAPEPIKVQAIMGSR